MTSSIFYNDTVISKKFVLEFGYNLIVYDFLANMSFRDT